MTNSSSAGVPPDHFRLCRRASRPLPALPEAPLDHFRQCRRASQPLPALQEGLPTTSGPAGGPPTTFGSTRWQLTTSGPAGGPPTTSGSVGAFNDDIRPCRRASRPLPALPEGPIHFWLCRSFQRPHLTLPEGLTTTSGLAGGPLTTSVPIGWPADHFRPYRRAPRLLLTLLDGPRPLPALLKGFPTTSGPTGRPPTTSGPAGGPPNRFRPCQMDS